MTATGNRTDRPEPRKRYDRPSEMSVLNGYRARAAQDIRSDDPSADRDRAAHRRTTWLYEDLLN